MTEDSGPSGTVERVFKKSSPNNKLTLYLSSRDLVVSSGKIDRLQGVLLVDPEFVEQRKVYGQVTLTFRYGREDEEVMGLKFCNEAVMCLAQLYPPHAGSQPSEANTPLQKMSIDILDVTLSPTTKSCFNQRFYEVLQDDQEHWDDNRTQHESSSKTTKDEVLSSEVETPGRADHVIVEDVSRSSKTFQDYPGVASSSNTLEEEFTCFHCWLCRLFSNSARYHHDRGEPFYNL